MNALEWISTPRNFCFAMALWYVAWLGLVALAWPASFARFASGMLLGVVLAGILIARARCG